jgi:hypothetical protein
MSKTVTAQELLKMYADLLADHKRLTGEHNTLLSVHCRATKFYNDTITGNEQVITSLRSNLATTTRKLERVQAENESLKKKIANSNNIRPKSIGVALTGDMPDYEYTTDGKRMCFINYQTGNRVYAGDALFHKLKNEMLA